MATATPSAPTKTPREAKASPPAAKPGAKAAPEPAADTPAWPLAHPNYSSLEAAVQGEAARWNVPGMSVAVLHDGVIDTVATGITSIQTKQPVTPDTIFQIGSISKVFTTTLAMQFVEEGLLDLDEPIVTYIPDLPLADPDVRAAVTLRHIFSHSAGFEGDTFDDYGRGDDATAKAIAVFDKLKQWFAPGELFSYNNNGFVLAALVLETVTGKTFEPLMQEHVFTPLKLENTVYFAENAITYSHAVGHFLRKREDGPVIARPYSFPRQINAPGGIIATASDLIRFAQMHINGGELDGTRVLSEETAILMQTPFINAWDQHCSFGQGWYISEYLGLKIIQHGGSTMGFRAMLRIAPERGFAIALLTNGDSGTSAYDSIFEWAVQHYLDCTIPKPTPASPSKKALDSLTGLYGRQNMRMDVTREDDKLRLRAFEVDPETGEEKTDGPFSIGDPLKLEAIESPRLNDFRVVGGPMDGAIVDFPLVPTRDDPKRTLIRIGGRVSELLDNGGKGVSAGAKKSAKTTKKS
ncbi:MAG: serine hydrolase domain-containing protein [Thermomicrobiales bacterium]